MWDVGFFFPVLSCLGLEAADPYFACDESPEQLLLPSILTDGLGKWFSSQYTCCSVGAEESCLCNSGSLMISSHTVPSPTSEFRVVYYNGVLLPNPGLFPSLRWLSQCEYWRFHTCDLRSWLFQGSSCFLLILELSEKVLGGAEVVRLEHGNSGQIVSASQDQKSKTFRSSNLSHTKKWKTNNGNPV